MKQALLCIAAHLLLLVLTQSLLLVNSDGAAVTVAATVDDERVVLDKRSYATTDPAAAAGMVVTESKLDMETTWSNLISALEENANIRIVATIDHTAAAESAGLDDLLTHPIRLVVFGNPNLGTPLMQEQLMAGIDLPQKMLVWQDSSDDGGKVYVGYNSVEYLEFRHAGIDRADTFSTIKTALANLAMTATGQPQVDDDSSSSIRLLQGHRGLRTKRSDADFETTWTRLLDAIEASPANVAFTVDHSQNSGGALNPSRLVVFGNPSVGTPLMQTSATAGIDLPLKILVWQDNNGYVRVTRNSVNFLKTRHGLDSTNLDSIEMALQNFVRVATQS